MSKTKKKTKKEEARESELVQMCQTNITTLDSMWQGLKKVWEQDDEQYNNEMKEANYVGASDLKSPATYDAIETLVGYAMKVLHTKGIPVRSRAPEGGDAEKVKLFNRATEIKMNMMRPVFRQRENVAYRRFQKFGVCAVKVPYNKELMGADFIPLRPDEIMFDPFVATMEEIDFFCHVVKRTKRQITKLYGKVDFEAIEEERKKVSNSDNMYQHTKTMFRLGGQSVPVSQAYWTVHECWIKTSVGDEEEKWHLVALLDGKTKLRAMDAPYDPPFLVQGLIYQEGTILGRSQPSACRQHQIALNDYSNQTMDCGTVALQPMMTVDQLANMELSQLKFRPFGVVPLDGPADSMKPIQMNLRPEIGMQMQAMTEKNIQRLTGATPSLIDSVSKDVVATESRRASNAADTRALEHMRLFVDNILIPWHKLDLKYMKERVKYEDFMRLVGGEAAELGEAQLKAFFNEKYDSIAEGFMDITDKLAKLQLLQNYMNLLIKMGQYANLPVYAVDYGELLGFENPSKYVHMPSPPELIHPRDENLKMGMGVKCKVHPRDPDVEHMRVHREAEVPEEGTPEHEEVLQLIGEHIAEHEKMHQMKQQGGQGGRPPAGMPGQEMQQPGAQGPAAAQLAAPAMRPDPTV